MCEKYPEGRRGTVTIYEIISSKHIKTLPEGDNERKTYKSREFVCSAFSHIKQDLIITLCGEPDWQIILWDWNMQKVIRTIAVGLSIPSSLPHKERNFMLSFNPMDRTGDSFLLTGPEKTFKYFKKDVEYNLSIEHTQINEMDPSRKISSNFTCHSWSQSTGHILICTDQGEMIVCENSGQYKAYILDSPKTGSAIEAVISLENGFLIAVGSDFYIYRTSNVDDRAPLKIHGEKCKLEIAREQKHLQT